MFNLKFDVAEKYALQIRKLRTLEVDMAKLPDNALRYIFEYGLQRVHNDSVGSVANPTGDKENAEWLDACLEAATKRRDSLYAGEIRQRVGEREPTDPIAAEARRLAVQYVKKEWKAENKAIPSKKDDAWGSFADRVKEVAANEKIRAKAEKIVALAEMDDIEL